MRNILLTFAFLVASCASQSTQSDSGYSLAPYFTLTPSLTPTPNVIVVVETPIPTSTPFMYVIQSGDTFSQLAEKFKISLDELRAANPNVNPNSMPVGGTLLVPDASSASLAAAPTPTPVSVPITQIVCRPSNDDGLWCFALIQNTTPNILENISAQINLLDENKNVVASQTAFAPLNIIPPSSALPVYIFFPNIKINVTPQAQLLSAVQLPANDGRYLPAQIQNAVTQISEDGLTAQVSGEVSLPAESKAATQIWIAAVAYDQSGQVAGLKRWQSDGSLQFNFTVSSLASAIDRVEFVIEARP